MSRADGKLSEAATSFLYEEAMSESEKAALLKRLSHWELKSASFTAVVGGRYQTDTSAGPITMTLPVGMVAGDPIEVQDASLSWGSNPLTIELAASGFGNKINGVAADFLANVDGGEIGIVAINGTIGVSIK